MDPNNLGYSKDEFNNFCVNEIIIEKSASHETGEYNEIQITNGLINISKEESSSSKSEKTKTAVTIGGSIGMAGGIGGVIIGTIIGISSSLTFLFNDSVIGISKATCFFKLSNLEYNQVHIELEDDTGETLRQVELMKTDIDGEYFVSFENLSPNTTYHLNGIDKDGKEINLGENNYFTTLDIPTYEIEVDTSNYNKLLEQYDLTFNINNPNEHQIDAVLFCENDQTLDQRLSSTSGAFNFTLPSVLSSYRLELYQEGYLVGQTHFSDYASIEILDTTSIGISSISIHASLGDIDHEQIDVFINPLNDLNSIIRPDVNLGDNYGDSIRIEDFRNILPETEYLLHIVDKNRPTFSYFTYTFTTIAIPHYEITIDDSGFDLANNQYDLTFNISNPNKYNIDAELVCFNDDTLRETYVFSNDSLKLTLPSPYSEYQLFLGQEGYDVGSIRFSYYNRITVIEDTIMNTSSYFSAEIDLGDVPFENLSAFISEDVQGAIETPIDLIPGQNENIVSVGAGGLTSGTLYVLKIIDINRPTFAYLSYRFVTP